MYASPPKVNLLVVHSRDIEKAKEFYAKIGLLFGKEKHDDGPEHYTTMCDGFVFEIYPLTNKNKAIANIRFGFNLDSVDEYLPLLIEFGATVVEKPHNTKRGRRAVIRDIDGHTVELLCNAIA